MHSLSTESDRPRPEELVRRLLDQARDPNIAGLYCYGDLQDLIGRLAAAVEFLLAENERLGERPGAGAANVGALHQTRGDDPLAISGHCTPP